MATVQVLATNIKSYIKNIDAVNKRASKLGINPITYTYGSPYVVTHTIQNRNSDIFGKSFRVKVVDFELSEYQVKLADWTVDGLISRKDGPVVLFGDIDESYRDVEDTRCDHCGTAHRRVKQAVVSRDNDVKVVGYTCLKDFTGVSVSGTNTLWNYIVAIETVIDYDLDDDVCGMNSRGGYDARLLVAIADKSIDEYGFIPTSGDYPTKIDVESNYRHFTTDDDIVAVGEAMITEFFELSKDDDSQFANNLKAILEVDYVSNRNTGFVVYVPQYIRKAKAKLVVNEEKAESQFVGVVGERTEFNVTVERKTTFDSIYGGGFVITFVDGEGNQLVWFASRSKGLQQGDVVRIVGRIKEHKNDDKYGKQTILTRVTVKG